MLPRLYVGSKNYSSWSMRPWLVLTWAGVAFEEQVIPLGPRGGGVNPAIAAISPTATVPVLHLPSGQVIWDSLAICEWAAEERPEAELWPRDRGLRALARSAVCEMHAGFARLRQDLPMNMRRRAPARPIASDVAAQRDRIAALWERCQGAAGGGPFLFGARPTIADAFYAPVATRFRTYGVELPAPAQAYVEAILGAAAVRIWEDGALQDPTQMGDIDDL